MNESIFMCTNSKSCKHFPTCREHIPIFRKILCEFCDDIFCLNYLNHTSKYPNEFHCKKEHWLIVCIDRFCNIQSHPH